MNKALKRLPDIQLWIKFKQGNRQAFKLIYYTYYQHLFNYGLKLSGHTDITEDCIQDLFLKLWKNKKNLGDVNSIKAYLFKSFRRILIDLIKSDKKNNNVIDLPAEYDVHLSVEEILIKNESSQQQLTSLEKALNNLSKRQKEIIYLCFFKGMSYMEITEVIPIKYQTVRNCMHEAVKILRKHVTYH
ncbi:sigma-70 family RNA polymerase sigma factor [Fulvivirgaceae bacterium BMA12]|uniref:Sigma-70 family RNA polymerase sigma factor n=1 Tax=Agaribacillus aureus TaxID=3051825 RepID=A0ABT8L6Z6_9BACT|nr:sigma-70 family RNA polymerase sigma factor [Fulvivirgaceae bacterium BMA12]